jgi:hypothetical protein
MISHAPEIVPREQWILAVLDRDRTARDVRERVARFLAPLGGVHGEHELRACAVPPQIARLGDVLARRHLQRRDLVRRAIPDGRLVDVAVPHKHSELASVRRPAHAAYTALVRDDRRALASASID